MGFFFSFLFCLQIISTKYEFIIKVQQTYKEISHHEWELVEMTNYTFRPPATTDIELADIKKIIIKQI